MKQDRFYHIFSTDRYCVGFIEEVWRVVVYSFVSAIFSLGIIYSSLIGSIFAIQDGVQMGISQKVVVCSLSSLVDGSAQTLIPNNTAIVVGKPLFVVDGKASYVSYAPCSGTVHWSIVSNQMVKQGQSLGNIVPSHRFLLFTHQSIPENIRDHYYNVRIALSYGSSIKGHGFFTPEGYYVTFDTDKNIDTSQIYHVASEDAYVSLWSYFSRPLSQRFVQRP